MSNSTIPGGSPPTDSSLQWILVIDDEPSMRLLIEVVLRSQGWEVVCADGAEAALDALNSELPHYKQIRAFRLLPEPFTMENGLLTTMGKLKRDAIAARYAGEIRSLYENKTA